MAAVSVEALVAASSERFAVLEAIIMATEHFTPLAIPVCIAHASVRFLSITFHHSTSLGVSATTALVRAAVRLRLFQRILGIRPAASVPEVGVRNRHTPPFSTSSQHRPSLPRLPSIKLPVLHHPRGPLVGDDTLARGPLVRDDTLGDYMKTVTGGGPPLQDDTPRDRWVTTRKRTTTTTTVLLSMFGGGPLVGDDTLHGHNTRGAVYLNGPLARDDTLRDHVVITS